jgi:RimJ/RimL family protein N-acetyltransferase
MRTWRAPALDSAVVAAERSTPRLRLRPYVEDDIDDWLAIEGDATIREAFDWPRRSAFEAVQHLRARTRHTTLLHSGDFLVLAAEYRGQVIGDVSLHLRTVAAPTRSVEMGWLLRSDFRGRRLATEAAEAMLDVAFEQVGANVVTAVVFNRNEPSAKLALRLGFRVAAHQERVTTYVLLRDGYIREASSYRLAGRDRPQSS